MCKKILLLALSLFLSGVLLQAESLFTFTQKQYQDMKQELNNQLLLTNQLSVILNQQTKQLQTLQDQTKNLSESLNNYEKVNIDLQESLIKESKKNKVMQITIGTVVPITFVVAIGAGLAIGFIVSNYVKNK